MGDGPAAEPIGIHADDMIDLAEGFSRDSQWFGEVAAPLRSSLTAEPDGSAAWVSASRYGAEFLSRHGDVKASADELLGVVTRDIASMGASAREAIGDLVGQDHTNGARVDATVPADAHGGE